MHRRRSRVAQCIMSMQAWIQGRSWDNESCRYCRMIHQNGCMHGSRPLNTCYCPPSSQRSPGKEATEAHPDPFEANGIPPRLSRSLALPACISSVEDHSEYSPSSLRASSRKTRRRRYTSHGLGALVAVFPCVFGDGDSSLGSYEENRGDHQAL